MAHHNDLFPSVARRRASKISWMRCSTASRASPPSGAQAPSLKMRSKKPRLVLRVVKGVLEYANAVLPERRFGLGWEAEGLGDSRGGVKGALQGLAEPP